MSHPDSATADRTYDTILIGTSPLMILEALTRAKAGESVAMVEKRPVLGGAWDTADLEVFGQVEMGCHFIERYTKAYQYLERFLGHPLVEMTPKPFALCLSWQFDRSSRIPAEIAMFLKDLRHGKVRSAFYHFRRVLWAMTRREKHDTTYFYPQYGCYQIMHELSRRLEESTVTTILNTTIHEVEIAAANDQCTCYTDNGTYQATHLVISSCTDLTAFQCSDSTIAMTKRKKPHHNVTLHLRGHKARPFSYAETFSSPYLFRISDVGVYSPSFVAQADTDELLLCIHIQPEKWEERRDLDRLSANVLAELQRCKFVTPDTTILNQWSKKYASPFTEERELQTLEEQLQPCLTALDIFDMGQALAHYADRWAPLLDDPPLTAAVDTGSTANYLSPQATVAV